VRKLAKISMASTLLCLTGIASAAMYVPPPAAEPAAPVKKNGVYVGVGLGGLGYNQDASATGTFTSPEISGSQSGHSNGGDVGLNETIFAGYEWFLPKHFFLGLEAYGNYANVGAGDGQLFGFNTSEVALSDEYSGQFRLKGVYGVRALPGYQINPATETYFIIGYARSKVDLNNNAGTATIEGNAYEIPSSTTSYDFNGYQLGIGAMTDITEHVALRADIIYTGYASKDIGLVRSADGTTLNSSGTLEPTTYEGNVSVVYKFD
jgi:opacity protein-like surface antigen